MALRITGYEDWMREQVIQLFVSEYKVDAASFRELFESFYFHPFQKNKCILIAAVDDKTVAGFQSFFFWPYADGKRTYASFQSGNSLIHPDYRGKGLFNQMLAYIEAEKNKAGIDFLMGFPVEASKKNFLKDGWTNLFDLKWFVKTCNPFGFFNSGLSSHKGFSKGMLYFETAFHPEGTLSLENSPAFRDWRNTYMKAGTYYTYRFEKGDKSILFHLKLNKRKHILNEAIIGNVLFSSEQSTTFLEEAIKELCASLRKSWSAHFISVAINDACRFPVKQHFEVAGFNETEKKIYFIVKPQRQAPLEVSQWHIYRSDID
ncbi:MAG: N-acetyltransferase family protein, partial [Bacteroidia bacterium]